MGTIRIALMAVILISGCGNDRSNDPNEVAKELIRASGSEAMVQTMIDTMTAQFPSELANAIKGLISVDEFISRMIPVYSKHYTVDEMNELIDFYNSEIGRRTIEIGPALMVESAEVGQQYMMEKISAIQAFR